MTHVTISGKFYAGVFFNRALKIIKNVYLHDRHISYIISISEKQSKKGKNDFDCRKDKRGLPTIDHETFWSFCYEMKLFLKITEQNCLLSLELIDRSK